MFAYSAVAHACLLYVFSERETFWTCPLACITRLKCWTKQKHLISYIWLIYHDMHDMAKSISWHNTIPVFTFIPVYRTPRVCVCQTLTAYYSTVNYMVVLGRYQYPYLLLSWQANKTPSGFDYFRKTFVVIQSQWFSKLKHLIFYIQQVFKGPKIYVCFVFSFLTYCDTGITIFKFEFLFPYKRRLHIIW